VRPSSRLPSIPRCCRGSSWPRSCATPRRRP